MKTQKFISVKTVISISLIVLIFTSACAQSGNNTKNKSNNDSQAVSEVAKPEMDLQAAVMTGNLEVVNQHIAAGSDINKKDQMSGSTPLITAATFDQKEIAKVLIDAGADLSLKNNDGATPYMWLHFSVELKLPSSLLMPTLIKMRKTTLAQHREKA